MNTTLSRSLALLISMFALTSSFSLSSNVSDDNTEEKTWIVEMVDLENTGSSTKYFVKKGMPPEQNKQNSNAFYYEIMDYESINSFIKEPNKTVDSIFRVSTSNSRSATVGIISKDNESDGYKLHLFYASRYSQYKKRGWVLNKINDTFFAPKKMEVTQDGAQKLYFNGVTNQIIEVTTILESSGYINFESKCLVNKKLDNTNSSKNNIRYKNSKILFWISIFIAFAFTAIYVIYKYWWLPRKKSL